LEVYIFFLLAHSKPPNLSFFLPQPETPLSHPRLGRSLPLPN
jgi:hypothetical protein